MLKDTNKNVRLGLFVLAGTVSLILAMYFIGAKQNLFTSAFRIRANFHNVDGLMPGNNVRFAGIDVGTVEKIEILSDSNVRVLMRIEEKSRVYIKRTGYDPPPIKAEEIRLSGKLEQLGTRLEKEIAKLEGKADKIIKKTQTKAGYRVQKESKANIEERQTITCSCGQVNGIY